MDFQEIFNLLEMRLYITEFLDIDSILLFYSINKIYREKLDSNELLSLLNRKLDTDINWNCCNLNKFLKIYRVYYNSDHQIENNYSRYYCFNRAIKIGNIDQVIQYTESYCEIHYHQDNSKLYHSILKKALKFNNLEFINRVYDYVRDKISLNEKAKYTIASMGCEKVLGWLKSKNLYAKPPENSAIRAACYAGNLKFVQKMQDIHNSSRSSDVLWNNAICGAVHGGHRQMINWCFQNVPSQINIKWGAVFEAAVHNQNIGLIKYIHSSIPVIPDDTWIYMSYQKEFQIEVVQWILSNAPKITLHHVIKNIIHHIISIGDIRTADWIWDQEHLRAYWDFPAIADGIIINRLINDEYFLNQSYSLHPMLVRWLLDKIHRRQINSDVYNMMVKFSK